MALSPTLSAHPAANKKRTFFGSSLAPLADEDVHAHVTSLIPSVVSVEGAGLCRKCVSLIAFCIRFRDDGSAEFSKGVKWFKTYGEPTALIPKLRQRAIQWG